MCTGRFVNVRKADMMVAAVVIAVQPGKYRNVIIIAREETLTVVWW